MDNEKRAEKLLRKYGFDFNNISRDEIIVLLNKEIEKFTVKNDNYGSSEYLRVLCGYLFCVGNLADIDIIKKAKYDTNFDIGCMIDSEWIDSMEGIQSENIRDRKTLIEESFVGYYKGYFNLT